MGKIVSFEGGIGAGKTTLVNYLSKEFGFGKILENDYQNPFIDEFYKGEDVKLETELSFLLQHYSLLKKARRMEGIVLADFSIGKDLVFARLNLSNTEVEVFKRVYGFVIESVGNPELIVYLDLPFETLMERVRNRGRENELNYNPEYFRTYVKHLDVYCKKLPVNYVIFLNDNNYTSNSDSLIKLGNIILSTV